MRVLPGLCPPPPALVVPPLVRGGCGCCCDCFGFARRRRPVLRRGSRGRGVSCWGSLRLQAAPWARAMRPLLLSVAACRCALLPSGRESAPSAWSACGLRLAPLLPSGRTPPCAFVPARCRWQPLRGNAAPAAKLHRKATKLNRKASKSPLFVRHIAASVLVCVNGQYAEKPRFRGFSGSH